MTTHPTISGTVRSMSGTARLLILGVFVNNLTAFLNAFLVLFLVHRGFSTWHAGIALAALLGGRVFGTAVGGAIADRIGYRWTIATSMGVGATLIVALVHAPDAWMAVLIAGATGLATQAYVPAAMAWLVELTPRNQQVMVFAINRLAFNVGATVGPLMAALLIAYSYDLLFYADAAASLGFCVIALTLLPADRAKPAEAGSAETEPGSGEADGAKAEDAKSKAESAKRAGYRHVLADTRFMLVTAGLFFTAIAYIQMSATLPLFITGSGYSERIYALLLSVNGFVVIALEVLLSKWTQRLPVGLPMAIGMGLLSLGHLLYLGPGGLSILVLATATWTLGEVVAAPSMMAYPGLVAPADLRGRYIAAATVPQQLGYALGPIVGIVAWQLWGSTVWLITAGCAALAVVLVVAGAGVRGAPAPQPEPEAVPAD
jgi:MFS family permease